MSANGLITLTGTKSRASVLAPSPMRSPGEAPASCKAGLKRVSGGTARIVCGTPKANVEINGKSYVFKGGECDLYPTYLAVKIGAFVRRGAFFVLLMGKSAAATASDPVVAVDGTYRNGLIMIVAPAARGVFLHDEVDLTITLKNGRRAGAFSATNPPSTALKTSALHVRGSFTC